MALISGESMKRGEVWVARLNPNKGAELGKLRPVIILQDDAILACGLTTVLVVPLTTQFRPKFAPLRIEITARDRLKKTCYAAVEQARAIDSSRFGDGPLTMLTVEEMRAIEKSLKAMMGLL
ncbi:MAG: type II toxin-antitoxin system PemK/MazF family toxin [Thiohalomonadaceae bacterium]